MKAVYLYTAVKIFSCRLLPTLVFFLMQQRVDAQTARPSLRYTVSTPKPSAHYYHVQLQGSGWNIDTLEFKMPAWMPGYYQLMNYGREVSNLLAEDARGKKVGVITVNENTWRIVTRKKEAFKLDYDVKADRQFVANSYVDTARAYVIPAATCLYISGQLHTPVTIKFITRTGHSIATGAYTCAWKNK